MISSELVHQRFASLSPRQNEIALLLANGLTNTKIAEQLGMTVHTVKAHRAEVMRRMEASSFADLVSQLQTIHALHPAPASDAPLHIIVVEDDLWYREYLVESLQARDFSVAGAANGAEFAAAWLERRANIVILDIELGSKEENGLAIAERLQASSHCGVILVTARGSLDDRLKGLQIGADAYFSKPVNIEELAMTLLNLGRRLR
ncbi:MAG: response regulator [Gallionellaceae bacterium]